MSRRVVGCVVFASLLVVGAAPDDAGQKELAKLQGTWKVESAVAGGEVIRPEKYAGKGFFIKGDEMWPSDKPADAIKLKVVPGQKPAAIDLTEPNEGTGLGIYELDSDSLKFCFGEK